MLNGHVSTRKRYIESSLDELAMEIEAYEHGGEVTPKENGYHRDTHVTETCEEPEPQRESVSPPVSVTELEAEPSFETLRKDEDELEAIAELIKSTEEVKKNLAKGLKTQSCNSQNLSLELSLFKTVYT